MISRYPTLEEVLAALREGRIVECLVRAIDLTREDLASYRRKCPEFAAGASPRGLANWIHDRLWNHSVAELCGADHVDFTDHGSTREIHVGLDFRIRLKRHSPSGSIRSYPTPTTLEFICQQPDLFSEIGIHTWNLCIGYEWDDQAASMGAAVMSLRDGSFNEVVWLTSLSGPADAGAVPLFPTDGAPTAPVIDVVRRISDGGDQAVGRGS